MVPPVFSPSPQKTTQGAQSLMELMKEKTSVITDKDQERGGPSAESPQRRQGRVMEGQEGCLEEAAFELICNNDMNTLEAGGNCHRQSCETWKGRLVVSRGTLSLRFKLTPVMRSISAMSHQACSVASWRGVCFLWRRSQGNEEQRSM